MMESEYQQIINYVDYGADPPVWLEHMLKGDDKLAIKKMRLPGLFFKYREVIRKKVPSIACGSENRIDMWVEAGGLSGIYSMPSHIQKRIINNLEVTR